MIICRGVRNWVLASAGDLTQHVFEHVALGIAVLHWDPVEHLDDLGEQVGVGESHPRFLHMGAAGGSLFSKLTQEEKDMLIHDPHHLARFEVLEA